MFSFLIGILIIIIVLKIIKKITSTIFKLILIIATVGMLYAMFLQ